MPRRNREAPPGAARPAKRPGWVQWVLPAALALVLAACAEVVDAPTANPSTEELFAAEEHPATHGHAGLLPAGVDREVAVTISEFAFEPGSVEVSPGETVMFTVENEGLFEHEFRLTTMHGAEEHIADGHEGHHDEGAGEGTDAHGDRFTLVQAGETKAMIVTFDDHAQFDIFACLIPGHYEEGMSGALTGLILDDHHASGDAADHHDDSDGHHDDAADHDDSDGHHDDPADHHDDSDGHHDDPADHDDSDGHHDATVGSGEADREIIVSIHDDEFHPHAIEVQRGETVLFTVVNEGELDHEFRLTTAHAAEEHVAAAGHGGSGDHAHGEAMMMVPAGATEAMVVTFGADAEFDLFACFLPGHYERGLSGDLQISG